MSKPFRDSLAFSFMKLLTADNYYGNLFSKLLVKLLAIQSTQRGYNIVPVS